jgi:hypothetical protein
MSMSGSDLHKLIYFNGYKPDHFEPSPASDLTVRIWSNMGRAQKQGATWGDICTYNRQEMDEVLAARSRYRSTPILATISIQEEAIVNQVVIERVAPSAPALPEIDFEPVKPKPVIKKSHSQPSKRPLCMGCGNYCIHSKPPDSWNAADRKRYCCLGCRDSSGKKHADRCQKHKPQ